MERSSLLDWARARRAALSVCAGLAFVCAGAGLALAQPYAAPPPPQFAPPPQEVQSSADARQDRIEELEAQVRAATAENERLQFQLMQAERENARLLAIVDELSAVNDSIVEGVQQSQQQRQQQAAPATSGLSEAQQNATGTLGELSASQAPASSAEAFRQAQQLLLNNQIAEAEVSFGEFLRVHGEAPEAADAQFWYSYTLLARNNFGAARDGFVAFLQRYPRHARQAEAQVRLGMALIGLDEIQMGCAAFRDLPGASSRAVRDLAAREARAASC